MTTENNISLSGADSRTLANEAAKVLLEKLGRNVQMFDAREYTSITDFYVNATGKSSTHVASLADDVAEHFSDRGFAPYRVEGRKGNSWILVDFGSLIVNVFDAESREMYNFERILPAEALVSIDDLVAEVDEKFNIQKKKDI
jgi:ribosome-associated protein